MTRYYEWASKPFTRSGLMLAESKLSKIVDAQMCSGYSTVYYFSQEDADEIKESGSSSGFKRYAVGADRIVLDLDDGDSQLEETEKILKDKGLQYEVWFSGKKGYHIYIPTEDMYDKDLPYSHLMYIRSLGIKCDESLYQHGRLLSLPGRIHPKTRKRKQKLRMVPGVAADVQIVQRPIFTLSVHSDPSHVVLAGALMRLSEMALNEPRRDARHTELWAVGKDLVNGGLRDDLIFNLLQAVMTSWDRPKDDEKLMRIISMSRRQA